MRRGRRQVSLEAVITKLETEVMRADSMIHEGSWADGLVSLPQSWGLMAAEPSSSPRLRGSCVRVRASSLGSRA